MLPASRPSISGQQTTSTSRMTATSSGSVNMTKLHVYTKRSHRSINSIICCTNSSSDAPHSSARDTYVARTRGGTLGNISCSTGMVFDNAACTSIPCSCQKVSDDDDDKA